MAVLVALLALALLIATNGTSKSSRNGSRASETAGQPSAATPHAGKQSELSRGRRLELTDDLGEMIVARYTGTTPSATFLQRIRAHQIGGVILFSENTSGGERVTAAAVARMQRAARLAHDYPLLIMTDQEGGTVKRLPEAPPALGAAAMASAGTARTEGYATGVALRRIGINLDLAPVADVERVPDSFLGTRAFGSSAGMVAERACGFAEGLAASGIGYTLKHFPGLGSATASTDTRPVVVSASKAGLRRDYGAYRRCGKGPRAVVMISSAGYPALTNSDAPAVLSHEIYQLELPAANVHATTISDDLDTPAIINLQTPARRAINAGLDLLLYAQTEESSALAYPALVTDLRSGSLSHARVLQAATAVSALKQALAD